MLAGVGILGILGNMLSIIVLNTKEMRTNCFNNLLTALNIADRLEMEMDIQVYFLKSFKHFSFLILFFILDILREEISPFHYAPLLPLFPHVHFPMLRVRKGHNLNIYNLN